MNKISLITNYQRYIWKRRQLGSILRNHTETRCHWLWFRRLLRNYLEKTIKCKLRSIQHENSTKMCENQMVCLINFTLTRIMFWNNVIEIKTRLIIPFFGKCLYKTWVITIAVPYQWQYSHYLSKFDLRKLD